jgi:glycosyltransferase involved in cell wall biosynthesis
VNAIVVIPAYNEGATIREVAARALLHCPRVIVVDDGSTDNTAAALVGLPVVLLRNPRNEGKAAALWRGIQHALESGAEAVITLDGDGQHRPEDIPRLLDAALHWPNTIIIGSRMANAAAFPPKRLFANRAANFWISWASGYAIEDSQSGFRLYPVALLRSIEPAHDHAHGFVFESEILIEASRRGVQSVPVAIEAIYTPAARPSHFRSVVDVVRITRMVAWKLLSRGLYLQGLFRAFLWPRARNLPVGGGRAP